MKRASPILTPTVFAVVAFFSGCGIMGCAHGSDKSGAERVFNASETETTTAITNALSLGRYQGMILSEAMGHDYLARGWHPTNGFVLLPGTGSVTYRAYLHIQPVPVSTGQTKVVVRTVRAEAGDGKEPGVHGGWAFHFRKVPAVRQEEENVLKAIAAELSPATNGPARGP